MRTVDLLVSFWQNIIMGVFAACYIMCIMPSRAHKHFRPVWKPLYNEKQVNFTHHLVRTSADTSVEHSLGSQI